ncbi:uncharacterized protein MYCFIDRAFT_181489 [Pseudocercospora fijiensis CIRAD86]|uniref:Uncharacterized protein n=1 Tax=Pseudocercospora fijiensis (strain CIRAD86) TaxID=383855 RepID=N1Q8Q3_PSEFD|nr:uncharacterized protein MYCFIDRAFT_181489 [Pseudocercospora fijiensis CIRAD86]EME89270.1 hypothetical protein MYCFIDRAFT_181489 [Pseudocercospora fijiensis CIRAD86]
MSHSPTVSQDEKKVPLDTSSPPSDPEVLVGEISDFEAHEVFRKDAAVNFRTVGWPRASVIFLSKSSSPLVFCRFPPPWSR